MPSVRYGREIVGFIQRTGLDYETVTYDRAWDLNKWGIRDYYDIRAAIDDFRVIHANLDGTKSQTERAGRWSGETKWLPLWWGSYIKQ
jgi:hypothetical protein